MEFDWDKMIQPKVVIEFKNEEQFNELIELAIKNGAAVGSYVTYSNCTSSEKYECLNFNGGSDISYCNRVWYESNKCTILSFEDVLLEEKNDIKLDWNKIIQPRTVIKFENEKECDSLLEVGKKCEYSFSLNGKDLTSLGSKCLNFNEGRSITHSTEEWYRGEGRNILSFKDVLLNQISEDKVIIDGEIYFPFKAATERDCDDCEIGEGNICSDINCHESDREDEITVSWKLKEEKEMKTKYKLIKDLAGESIFHNACKGEFEIFVKKYGFYNKVDWEKEEGFIVQQNGWITFFKKHGFIEENKPAIEFDEDKVYVFDWNESLYKICKGSDYSVFDVVCISNTVSWTGTTNYYKKSGQAVIDRLIVDNHDVKEFDNILDAVKWYVNA